MLTHRREHTHMKHYTHDYQSLYNANTHGTADSCEYYTQIFERDAAEHLEGLDAYNVGGVVVYRDAERRELAWFDYENLVGSVHALGGTASTEA